MVLSSIQEIITRMVDFIWRLPRNLVAFFIKVYQKTLSPDHGFMFSWMFPDGYCRFSPTCSEYSRQAVLKYGVVLGLLKAVWRVLRCNPWSCGGHDEV